MSKAPVTKDLTVLTDAEQLWFYRRAVLKKNQYEAAILFNVGHNQYCDMELGRRHTKLKIIERFQWNANKHPVWKLRLARRRSHMSLKQVAKRLGVSHVKILTMEKVADGRLLRFWQYMGFKF